MKLKKEKEDNIVKAKWVMLYTFLFMLLAGYLVVEQAIQKLNELANATFGSATKKKGCFRF